jgi:prepilin peptidase CpaA
MISQTAMLGMAAVLVLAMTLEIRTGRIPNWLTLIPFAIFIGLLFVADDRTSLYWQMGLAAAVFIFGLVLFAIGGSGAGAVKLLTCTALFVPFENAFVTFLLFLAIFLGSSISIVALRKVFGSEDSKWHVMANAVLPLSFSIGTAGLLGMFAF